MDMKKVKPLEREDMKKHRAMRDLDKLRKDK